MDVVALIGRILFAFLFIASGVNHLAKTEVMAGMAAARGVPQPKLATLASGVVIAVGGLMVLLGIYADLGALLLALFLVSTSFLMHTFWKETDETSKQMIMIQFMKDLSLAGAALLIFALYAELGDQLGITITGPLF